MAVTAMVTSAGSMPAAAVIKALKAKGDPQIRVISVDMDPLSVGFYLGDEFEVVPRADEPQYIEALLRICREEGVDVLFPIIDDELIRIAENRNVFDSLGVRLISNSIQSVRTCRDKWLTSRVCVQNGIPTPRTVLADDVTGLKELDFPLVVKPRFGRGTIGVHTVNDRTELDYRLRGGKSGLLVQELVAGTEYTIDVLTDFSGRPLALVPKERIQVKAGMQTKGRTRKDPALQEFALKIHQVIDLTPRANIQCIHSGSATYLIEVNPKFSTSLPLTVAAGINGPQLLVRMALGEKIPGGLMDFQDGLVMLRCWQEVFV